MINLLKLDETLNARVGKEYSFLGRIIKNYEEEHKRILKAREEEFKNAPKFLGIWSFPYNKDNYSYSIFNKLAAKQIYYIDKGDVGIRTEEFSLPVSPSTEIEKVEIYSSAKIPCGCWEGVRKNIAEDYNLNVGDNEFYANADSIFGGVTSKIMDVKNAKERLEAGIQKDFNDKLLSTKI